MPVPEGRLLVVDGEEFFVHPSDEGDATHCDLSSIDPETGHLDQRVR